MNLYVGNLSYQATEEDLQEEFAAYGQVASASIVRDRFSGESRGFGFVEMPNQEEALAAIAGLAGKEMGGRTITVNEARPRDDSRRRPSGGGGGGYGGGGDRGGSGGGYRGGGDRGGNGGSRGGNGGNRRY